MDQEKYILLIYKQLRGELSVAEEQVLEEWLHQSIDNQEFKSQILQSVELLEDYEPGFSVSLEEDFGRISAKLDLQMKKPSKPLETKIESQFSRRQWMSMAASFTLLIAASFLLWQYFQSKPVEMLVWETGVGEVENLELEDGSKVWLNEHSQLSCEKGWTGKIRAVKLRGEAFFEVAKDKDKIFEITTAFSKVEVIGTSFNLKAYEEEENTTLTVKTGKVEFRTKEDQKSMILIANQAAILNHSQQSILQKEINRNAFAWKNKTLEFENTPLLEVFEILESYFEVEIIYEEEHLKTCRFTSKIKDPDLTQIWKTLKVIYRLEVEEIAENQFLISGGGC